MLHFDLYHCSRMYEKNKCYHERMDWFNKHLPKKCDTIPWSASMNMNIMGLTGSNVNLRNDSEYKKLTFVVDVGVAAAADVLG